MRYRSLCAAALLAVSILAASEHRGQVTFRGFPVPGATVTADQNGRKLAAITDQRGFYSFTDLAGGTCVIEVGMFGFVPIRQTVAVAPDAPVAKWELTMLPPDRLKALAGPDFTGVRGNTAASGAEARAAGRGGA